MAMQDVGSGDPRPTGTTRELPPSQPGAGPSNDDIAGAFAAALGIDVEPNTAGAVAESFFDEVRREAKPAVAAQQAAQLADDGFVHEPTGKRFKTELELYKYDSGYNNQRLGEENVKLRADIERLGGDIAAARKAPDYQPTRDDLKRTLWPTRSADELGKDAAADFVLEGVGNAIQLAMGSMEQKLAERDGKIASLVSQLSEMSVRSEHKLDPQIERQVIEKYPGLKALPPADRVAIAAALANVAGNGATRTASTASTPAQRASDYVETAGASVREADGELSEESVMRKFDKIDDPRKELALLGDLVKRSKEFAGLRSD